jgi:hypothetical protein
MTGEEVNMHAMPEENSAPRGGDYAGRGKPSRNADAEPNDLRKQSRDRAVARFCNEVVAEQVSGGVRLTNKN